ncbi:MAG: disulfide oxidoreductase, partial [Halocynthiibacter sp.]
RVPEDWLAQQIKRLDRNDGDIDTLSKRLAYIRTWTYVSQRRGWVDDENHWRGTTRAVEDRLSDALHAALTQRFVDRRTSVLLRRLKQKESLVAELNDKNEVTIEGQFVGRLDGFRFSQDQKATPQEAKTLRAAAFQALAPEFHLRADRIYNAPDTELDFTEQGGLMWGENAVGKLVAGADILKPRVQAFVDEEAGADIAEKVARRLQHFIDRKIALLFEPLLAMSRDETLTGLARGFAFRVSEALGILARDQVASDVKELDQDARATLRKHGIRFGQFTVFMPILLKPAATRLRLVLWALSEGHAEFCESPPPGLVTVPSAKDAPAGYDRMSGFRQAGERAIRIDMLERLADLLRVENSRTGFEAKSDMLSITGMTLEQFADLMQGLGYKAQKGQRDKIKQAAPLAEASGEGKDESGPSADTHKSIDGSADTDAAAALVPDVGEINSEVATPEAATPEAATPEAAAPEAAAPEAAAPDVVTPDVATPEHAAPESAAPEGAMPESAAPDETNLTVPETETFYTFTWARPRPAGANKPKGKPQGKSQDKPSSKQRGKPKGKNDLRRGAQTHQARPTKKDRIDPDNPFAAALMGLKDKS